MKRAFSLLAVASIGLLLAACTFATAEAAPALAAMASSVDPGGASSAGMALALGAAGLTASPSLQAEDAAAEAVAVAPRVTLESIEAKIGREQTHVFDGGTLTVHVLTMANGFQVTGESACASQANYNEELGRQIARDNAIRKVWALEGYLLKEKIHQSCQGDQLDEAD